MQPPKPNPELSDYLLAHGLLADYEAKLAQGKSIEAIVEEAAPEIPEGEVIGPDAAALYAEAQREVFGGDHADIPVPAQAAAAAAQPAPEPNAALKIAYSKLPQAMRNRRLGLPSLHPPLSTSLHGSSSEAPA
jgi:hypothetical protein